MRRHNFFVTDVRPTNSEWIADGLLIFSSRQQGVLKVELKRIAAIAIACQTLILFGATGTAHSQTKVALVDIGQVFKSHPQFKQQLDGLKAEAEQFKSSTQELQKQLMQKAEVLKNYQPTSPEFKAAETELAKESAAMEVQQRDKMRGLMEREARLHYDTYMEIKQLIGSVSEDAGVKLVLRYNDVKMNADEPATIMQRVNGEIVYHRPANDITQTIIAQLPAGGSIR